MLDIADRSLSPTEGIERYKRIHAAAEVATDPSLKTFFMQKAERRLAVFAGSDPDYTPKLDPMPTTGGEVGVLPGENGLSPRGRPGVVASPYSM